MRVCACVYREWAILNPKAVSTVVAVAYTALEVYCFEISVLVALGIRFKTETMQSLQESYRFDNSSFLFFVCKGYFIVYVWEGSWTLLLKKCFITSMQSTTGNSRKGLLLKSSS